MNIIDYINILIFVNKYLIKLSFLKDLLLSLYLITNNIILSYIISLIIIIANDTLNRLYNSDILNY